MLQQRSRHLAVRRNKILRGKRMPEAGCMSSWYKYLSQRTTKPTIRVVRPAKTQISLRIRAV